MSIKRQTSEHKTYHPDNGVLVRTFAIRHVKPSVIADHVHDWHQLIFASEGVMWVHTDDGEWVVPPNRAVWVPAGVRHSIDMSGPVFVQTLYIHPGVKASLSKHCAAVNVSPLLRELILYTVSLGALNQADRRTASLTAFLFDQLSILPAMAMQLPAPSDARARQLVDWMHAHPADNGSIRKLARRCCMSVRTLERVFIKETGMSIGKWRTQLRLLQALRLIAEKHSITQVAQAVGYDSTSAFIAAFKRILGTTPGQYFK